jgi:hypothetical protein
MSHSIEIPCRNPHKHGARTIGIHMHLSSHGPVFVSCLLLQKIHGLQSKSIDFVLAFPQADLDVPVFMELPAGVNPIAFSDENQRCHVLKLNKSLYGLKQAGYNWFEKLQEGLITRDFYSKSSRQVHILLEGLHYPDLR